MGDESPDLELSNYEHLRNIFNSTVPLPLDDVAGQVDTRPLDNEVTEPGYAWEKLPHIFYEYPDSNASRSPFLSVDLCSSVPVHAQQQRVASFAICSALATEVVENFLSRERPLSAFSKHTSKINLLRQSSLARGMLESAIQESIFNMTPTEHSQAQIRPPERLYTKRLLADLASRDYLISPKYGNLPDEYYWEQRFRKQTADALYADLLRPATEPYVSSDVHALREPPEFLESNIEPDVIEFIWLQACHISQVVVGQKGFAPRRHLSLDYAKPSDIASSAQAVMPLSIRGSQLFTQALKSLSDPNQHITASILEELPLPDNSIDLMTCFDGWPLHFLSLNDEPAKRKVRFLDTIERLYEKLAPAGNIVIFPLQFGKPDQADASLISKESELRNEYAASFALSKNIPYTFFKIHRDALRRRLSSTDQEIAAALSPIFKAGHTSYTALVLTKPRSDGEKFKVVC